jgi:hypothetical protein
VAGEQVGGVVMKITGAQAAKVFLESYEKAEKLYDTPSVDFLLAESAAVLQLWTDCMIDRYAHQNQLGPKCACRMCVYQRSKSLLKLIEMSAALE